MSDLVFSEEQLKQILTDRDRKIYRHLLSQDLKRELQNGKALHVVLEAMQQALNRAVVEFATIADPGDRAVVSAIQARIFRYLYIRATIDEAIAQGEHDLEELREADRIEDASDD